MAEDIPVEDYPTEIVEQLTGFESSVGAVNNMVQTVISMPRNELVQRVSSGQPVGDLVFSVI